MRLNVSYSIVDIFYNRHRHFLLNKIDSMVLRAVTLQSITAQTCQNDLTNLYGSNEFQTESLQTEISPLKFVGEGTSGWFLFLPPSYFNRHFRCDSRHIKENHHILSLLLHILSHITETAPVPCSSKSHEVHDKYSSGGERRGYSVRYWDTCRGKDG